MGIIYGYYKYMGIIDYIYQETIDLFILLYRICVNWLDILYHKIYHIVLNSAYIIPIHSQYL